MFLTDADADADAYADADANFEPVAVAVFFLVTGTVNDTISNSASD